LGSQGTSTTNLVLDIYRANFSADSKVLDLVYSFVVNQNFVDLK